MNAIYMYNVATYVYILYNKNDRMRDRHEKYHILIDI